MRLPVSEAPKDPGSRANDNKLFRLCKAGTISYFWGLMNKAFPIFIIALCLTACHSGTDLPDDLRKAESLVDSKPDSAAAILDSRPYTAADGAFRHASWCLLKTYADYNSYKPQLDEEIMNSGVQWFLRHGSDDRKALAYYLRSVVNQENKSGNEAEWVHDLMMASRQIEGSDNHLLAALIHMRYATALNERRWYNSSIPEFEKGIEEARAAGSKALEITGLINTSHALMFLADSGGDYSEAIRRGEEAVSVAKEGRSENDYARALYGVAAIYSRDGQFAKALECASEGVRTQERLVKEGKRKERVRYVVLADAFRKMEMADSALFYAAKDLDAPSLVSRITASQLMYIVYRDLLHDDANAVKYLTLNNQLNDQRTAEQQSDKIIESRVELEKADARSSRARIIGTALSVLIVLAVAIFVMAKIFRNKLESRDSAIEEKEEELNRGQAKLIQSERNRSELRSVLMDEDKLVTSLRESDRYLSDKDWKRLDEILDKVCDHFPTRLRSSFPDITQNEMRIATLLRFRFNGKQMSSMLGISPVSVTKAKQRLRLRLSSAMPEGCTIDEFIASF